MTKNPPPSAQNPYGNGNAQGGPQGYYQQPPPPKKRRIWPWVLIGILVLFFGGCMAIVASMNGGDEPTVTSESDDGGQPADSGLTFPGMQPGDTAANAGDAVTVDDVTTMTTPLFDTTSFGSAYLCTTVTIRNDGASQASFNALDWKMQEPSGTIRNSSFSGTDNLLTSGEVAAGGSTTGDVCFDSPEGALPGQYIVLNDPTFDFSSDRIGWINQR